MHPAFQHNQYSLRRQVFALTGKFRVYSPDGHLVMFSQQKMFKLKEDIRVYSDESKSQELLYIQARQILDFSAAYDVTDATTNLKVGVLRRRGMRSIMRDEWQVLNAQEGLIGTLIEDSMAMAMLRRLVLGALLPQNYDILVNNEQAADIRQKFNLFRYELGIDFSMDTGQKLDHRLGIAAAILLATIEGRQE